VIGVGIFCLSLLLPWFSEYLPVGSDTPGWMALAFPLGMVAWGLRVNAAPCGIGLFALALEGLTFYIFATCVVALFKPGIPNPKWWHCNVLLLTSICFFLSMWYLRKDWDNIADVGSGYWVALGSFLVVLVGLIWQKGLIVEEP
jgi:hypothetical protein